MSLGPTLQYGYDEDYKVWDDLIKMKVDSLIRPSNNYISIYRSANKSGDQETIKLAEKYMADSLSKLRGLRGRQKWAKDNRELSGKINRQINKLENILG